MGREQKIAEETLIVGWVGTNSLARALVQPFLPPVQTFSSSIPLISLPGSVTELQFHFLDWPPLARTDITINQNQNPVIYWPPPPQTPNCCMRVKLKSMDRILSFDVATDAIADKDEIIELKGSSSIVREGRPSSSSQKTHHYHYHDYWIEGEE